jgi:hypothetical protein
LRTYHYFAFFKLSQKRFERGFFNLNSLRKFAAKRLAPLVRTEPCSFFENAEREQRPSLLYKLSSPRRYFVRAAFTTHLQKESLALSPHFTNSVIRVRSFAARGTSVFN